jgi:ribonuclease P protein component
MDAQPLPTRIGLSISLKVDKRAVVRNRIRRRLQAIVRQLLPYMSSNRDLLITVHPQAAQCDYLQFLQELEQLLVDAEVLHGYQRGCVL